MAYDDIFQPRIYKAWTEAIIKEKKIRMKWNEDYNAKLKEKSKEEFFEDESPELPCTCKDGTSQAPSTEVKMDWPRKGATGTNTLIRVFETPSVMNFPPPRERGALYEGISREGKGRAGYLRSRWRLDPEERFRKPICTSWMHGWNHGKANELSCKNADHCNIRDIAFGFC